MPDELQTAPLEPRPLSSGVATAENSTTLALHLKTQKRNKVIAAILSTLASLGFGLTFAPNTIVQVAGAIAFGVFGVAGTVFAAASGAEIDEKQLEALATRASQIVDRLPKKTP